MNPNSDTQDNVETTATENTGDERQEHEEQPGIEPQEPEQEKTEQEQEGQKQEEERKKARKNSAKERIEHLARERAQLLLEVEELKAKQNAPKPLEAPKVEDFEDYSEYQRAQQDWYIAQAEERVLAKVRQEQKQQSSIQQKAAFESAMTELEEEGVDVAALTKKADTLPPLPIQLDQFGLGLKETLKLAADLIQNDELYFELSQMNPVQAARRIGQEIDKQSGKSAAPKIPNAPKPIKPTSANAPVKRSEDSMSDEEFLAKRRAERLKG